MWPRPSGRSGPFAFTLRYQWWVWYIVVWTDGHRERSEEDYPPWSVVAEMQSGKFTWDREDLRRVSTRLNGCPRPSGRRRLLPSVSLATSSDPDPLVDAA